MCRKLLRCHAPTDCSVCGGGTRAKQFSAVGPVRHLGLRFQGVGANSGYGTCRQGHVPALTGIPARCVSCGGGCSGSCNVSPVVFQSIEVDLLTQRDVKSPFSRPRDSESRLFKFTRKFGFSLCKKVHYRKRLSEEIPENIYEHIAGASESKSKLSQSHE